MLRVYVKFHDEAEKNPALDDEGRKHFKLLEDGNEEEVKLWTRFKDLSLKEFDKLFEMLKLNLILLLVRASTMIKWMLLLMN